MSPSNCTPPPSQAHLTHCPPGHGVTSGYMGMQATTSLYGGPAIQTPIDVAAMRDVQAIMAALQQQL